MAQFLVAFGLFVGWKVGAGAMVAFVVGAVTSILAGWIGMKIAVYTNFRTTHECWASITRGYEVAIRGGCVMGFSLVSLGVLNGHFEDSKALFEAVAGYGLGGSSIALFGRVG